MPETAAHGVLSGPVGRCDAKPDLLHEPSDILDQNPWTAVVPGTGRGESSVSHATVLRRCRPSPYDAGTPWNGLAGRTLTKDLMQLPQSVNTRLSRLDLGGTGGHGGRLAKAVAAGRLGRARRAARLAGGPAGLPAARPRHRPARCAGRRHVFRARPAARRYRCDRQRAPLRPGQCGSRRDGPQLRLSHQHAAGAGRHHRQFGPGTRLRDHWRQRHDRQGLRRRQDDHGRYQAPCRLPRPRDPRPWRQARGVDAAEAVPGRWTEHVQPRPHRARSRT